MDGEEEKSDERCIQEIIAQFYSFFGSMMMLKQCIDQLPELHEASRGSILSQLEIIERQYKDSQEWFVTREVQDVRVGVVGTERSLKSALVSLFVEGVLEIEGDERDGRFKSKITVDGKHKLLLIREETPSHAPSRQLSQWVDVLLLTFNYTEEDSLRAAGDYYRAFREVRDNTDVPVMLVGVKGHFLSEEALSCLAIREGDVKKAVEAMDKCPQMDIALDQHSVCNLFAHACRLALNSATSYSAPQWPFFPPSPHTSLGVPGGGRQSSAPPVSPSHIKRGSKRKTFFQGGTKGTYNVSKQSGLATVTESIGSGRHIPLKEGPVSKKSMGMRSEWKKKYLVLSQSEITYYPSLSDYMNMTNAKALSLQQITVKVPGQRVPSTSRTGGTTAGNFASSSSEPSDGLTVSDRSNSVSPTPYDSTDFPSPPIPSLRVMATSPRGSRYLEDNHSPGSPDDFSSSTDTLDESSSLQFTYEQATLDAGGRGHNRNSSMDEITLQQLRGVGMTYQSGGDTTEAPREPRYNTMSRLEKRRSSRERGRGILSTALVDQQLQLEGSSESIGSSKDKRRSKAGEQYRNSWMIDRSPSEGGGVAKDKKSKAHKRQRSWGGNKMLDTQQVLDGEQPPDVSEFQIIASDGKMWILEANNAEEATSWVKAIEEQIKKMISESTSHKRMHSCNDVEKKEITMMDGNGVCADCLAPDPEWASLNHGCLLCIECSGVHRQLGSHISRVRSLSLDEWSPRLIALMLAIGNQVHWSVWEAKRPRNKPIHSTSREEREQFIHAKYVYKEFLAEAPFGKSIALQLLDAVKASAVAIPSLLNILAHATSEDINCLHDPPDTWSPLHIACSLGRISLVYLLIWSGADVRILDSQRRTPLFYARSAGQQDCVDILKANGCYNDSFTASPTSSDAGSADVLISTA